ncbi:MAG: hypothetical protein HZB76_07360 [Chlamydiae bacterium]|nr:hypothetical protein [Chlamydiota bacterium]
MSSNQNERLKLCPHCDGRVLVEVALCPYCGVTFEKKELVKAEEKLPNDNTVRSLSPEETLVSLYPPPYRVKPNTSVNNFEAHIPQEEVKVIDPIQEEALKEEPIDTTFLSTILFSVGVNIALLGLFIFLFAQGKSLILSFNASYWILYILAGAPLIYFGYKGLIKKN